MPEDTAHEVTRLLQDAESGDSGAAAELLPIVYAELRTLAKSRMGRERPGQTLQATALVHEAYLRLLGDNVSWQSRGHFFGAAAEAMRRILVEQARRKARLKHGGEFRRTSTPVTEIGLDGGVDVAILDIDEALSRLEARDEAMANVVKLRYFAGLTIEETAAALDVSPRAVNRHWTAARAWLTAALGEAHDGRQDA
ncbi:MAG: ECF-type sigma factor [Woeseiaceae bacterium]|nr:ECF-type sigma factor [Woeseiaceae bacterium]